MNVSARMDYGCRALLELALAWPEPRPVAIEHIAEAQKIPAKFLPHVLLDLKKHNLVRSVRGKSGGYCLARDPHLITGEDMLAPFGGLSLEREGEGLEDDVIHQFWERLSTCLQSHLKGVTLADLCAQYRKNQDVLIFNI